ncbi:hypothetical protein AB0B25_07680 [Nocardia sp. NPDC049190]|uniref:hypothetical protein n=1 Tax=Nocardia sp. NPDC049190 TaxID=3155650 RepID=UPI0034000FB7
MIGRDRLACLSVERRAACVNSLSRYLNSVPVLGWVRDRYDHAAIPIRVPERRGAACAHYQPATAGHRPQFCAVFCELLDVVISPEPEWLMRTTLIDTGARLGPIAPTRQERQVAMDILALTHEVASALGPDWVADRGYMVKAHAVLYGPDQQILYVTHDDSHRRSDHGGLHIRAAYGELGRNLGPSEGSHVINIAATRPPAAIAADITRWLLPDYEQTLALCRTRARADTLRLAERRRTLESLCQQLAPAQILRGDRVSFGQSGDPVRGEIRILHSGEAELELHATGAAAMRLARHIATRRYRSDQEQP